MNVKLLRALAREGFRAAHALIALFPLQHGEDLVTEAQCLICEVGLSETVAIRADGDAIVLVDGDAVARVYEDDGEVTRNGFTNELSANPERAPEKTPSRRARAAWRRDRADHWERYLARYMRGPDQTRSRSARQRSRERAQARKLKYA